MADARKQAVINGLVAQRTQWLERKQLLERNLKAATEPAAQREIRAAIATLNTEIPALERRIERLRAEVDDR
jgi:hypothetical protein